MRLYSTFITYSTGCGTEGGRGCERQCGEWEDKGRGGSMGRRWCGGRLGPRQERPWAWVGQCYEMDPVSFLSSFPFLSYSAYTLTWTIHYCIVVHRPYSELIHLLFLLLHYLHLLYTWDCLVAIGEHCLILIRTAPDSSHCLLYS